MSVTINPSTGNALPAQYRLGEYTIQTVLGQGGFGITYLAQDTRLKTQVAIKEYFPQAYARRDASASIFPLKQVQGALENYEWGLGEFLKEAQVLARFKHPHIVRVLRFIETNGTAYMVMEYEAGESLLAYLRRHGGFLAEPMLLNIFIPVLNGLQAVHDAGLLHLDIKPDNIYLRGNGQPMLIDFGSSRQAREDGAANQKVALSSGYAAPEQYPGYGEERGPWSDVYGMGASLYRCVTGREPADSIERIRIFAKNRVDPIVPASNFDRPHYSPHIRSAIDAALRIKAEERPRSARALQNGLMGKELKDEQAAVSWAGHGRGAGFIGIARANVQTPRRRRERRGFLEYVIATSVFVAAMLVTIPKVLISTGHLTEQTLYAQIDATRDAVRSVPRRIKRFLDEDILGREPMPAADAKPVRTLPKPRPAPEKKIEPFEPLKQMAHVFTLRAPAMGIAVAGDGAVVATASNDGAVQLWDGGSGQPLRILAAKRAGSPAAVAASADGQWLAYSDGEFAVRLLNLADETAPPPLGRHTDAVNALAFSPDGAWLASAGEDGRVMLWDTHTRHAALTLNARSVVLALAFAPNGRMLAAADAAGAIQYWDIPGGAELAYTPAQDQALTALAYSPDGKWLAVGGQHRFAKLLSIGMGRDDHPLAQLPETVHAIAFSPDGQWLLLAGADDDAVEIRDALTGNIVSRLAGHARGVQALAVSADGKLVVSADSENNVRLWR